MASPIFKKKNIFWLFFEIVQIEVEQSLDQKMENLFNDFYSDELLFWKIINETVSEI